MNALSQLFQTVRECHQIISDLLRPTDYWLVVLSQELLYGHQAGIL